MTMTSDDRKEAARSLAKDIFATKTADMAANDLLAAVNAVDDWIDENQASFLAALPEPFATRTTGSEKLRLFMWVAQRRVG